jgi:hypothetical protein
MFLHCVFTLKGENALPVRTGVVHSPALFTLQNIVILINCLPVSITHRHVCACIVNCLNFIRLEYYTDYKRLTMESHYFSSPHIVLTVSNYTTILFELKVIQTLNTFNFLFRFKHLFPASIRYPSSPPPQMFLSHL